jgi:hypothetical protein
MYRRRNLKCTRILANRRQRGLGPVWIWNPPVEEAKLAVIASR